MSLREALRRLASMPATESPFVSIYLNLAPQGPGVLTHPVFLKKRFPEELRRYPERSRQRSGLEAIAERVQNHLDFDLPNGLRAIALFARSGTGDFFDVMHVPTAFSSHVLVIAARPYLYPLVRLTELAPPTVAAVVDTNTARLFVLSLGQIVLRRELHGENLHRPQSGGWSQARLQRHVEDHYLHHAKQTARLLDLLVREQRAEHVLIGGDQVILPELGRQLSSTLRSRLLAEPHWDIRIAEHELAEDARRLVAAAERRHGRRRTVEILDTARGNGPATAGVAQTLLALGQGKVTELLVEESEGTGAWIDVCASCSRPASDPSITACPECGNEDLREELLYGMLVREAIAHGGEVRVVEPNADLTRAGGVAAALRYR